MLQDYSIYLQEGPLTKITARIQEISDSISGSGVDLLFNIAILTKRLNKTLRYVSANSNEDSDLRDREYQQRSADQIIKSKYFFGCSDIGLIYRVLAITKNVPAKYIQTVDIKESKIVNNDTYITGHVYIECYLQEGIFLIDPVKAVIVKIESEEDKNSLYKTGDLRLMREVASGLDNMDAGIKDHKDQLNQMKKTFLQFV